MEATSRRADWMYRGKLGLTTHYFPRRLEEVDRLAEQLDVRRIADQCGQVGAAWFLLTVHHQAWLMLAPNDTYDRIIATADHTTERDVPAELAEALAPHDCRLMLYVNLRLDPDGACPANVREAMGGWPPDDRLIDNVAAVYRDFSLRYGRRVAGWWVDGAWIQAYKGLPVEQRERWFAAIAEGLRAGNEDAVVAFNPGVKDAMMRYSRQNDYLAGEANDLIDPPVERFLDGAQWHAWTYLGPWWGSGGVRFDDDRLRAWARDVIAGGGVISFEVGTRGLIRTGRHDKDPARDGPVGAIDPRQVAQAETVADAIRNIPRPQGD
ncbi:MAG: hypothetical protein ACOC7R_05040 [Planctomycetota bacterium]